MAVRLIESLATTGPLADLFSDETVLQSMLRFEAALARAEAGLGVIPRAAAAAISAAASAAQFDAGAISGDAAHSGTPAIPFLRAFTESVRTRDHDAAGFAIPRWSCFCRKPGLSSTPAWSAWKELCAAFRSSIAVP
jgi:hypothetical protein